MVVDIINSLRTGHGIMELVYSRHMSMEEMFFNVRYVTVYRRLYLLGKARRIEDLASSLISSDKILARTRENY